MKFIHISDLHLGKKVNEFSMLDDQEYILSEIVKTVREEKADGVIIAGDVYDKGVPPTEAINLFDKFIVELVNMGVKVFIISGNHDSAERLAFGSKIFEHSGVYISKAYEGEVKPISLEDKDGKVNIYLMPFVKPAHVRRYFPDAVIENYTDALSVAVNAMNVNRNERNILVTHQYVTGADRSESEELMIGGTENVDVSAIEPFDYVALGHLHRPQKCSKETIRYSGSPLKYSLSEANDKKGLVVIELGGKGEISVKKVELVPKRDLREVKGKYDEITLKSFYENTNYKEDYIFITLTDEENVPNALEKLRAIYGNIMKLTYDNMRTRYNADIEADTEIEHKTYLDIFSEFFLKMNNKEINEEQREYLQKVIDELADAKGGDESK